MVSVKPLAQNRYTIANAAKAMRAQAETALFDGIKKGIELTDEAEGENNAIRAVVVLSDGQANAGATKLDDLVTMMSRNELTVKQFGGMANDVASDANGQAVPRQDIIGRSVAVQTKHPVQVFFIGIGKDADMDVGRILAQATGAEFQGVTEKDLAAVLEQFSKYF